jgi:hypothetical protein
MAVGAAVVVEKDPVAEEPQKLRKSLAKGAG